MKTNMITLANQCLWCGKEYTFDVPAAGYMAWRNGALIQDAFPTLTAEEREYMLTGYCKTCQDKLFGDEED